MIRHYNGGFDHEKLMRLTYRQFLMYYTCLVDMLEAENPDPKKPKAKQDPLSVMQEVKNKLN